MKLEQTSLMKPVPEVKEEPVNEPNHKAREYQI